jgi:hypothetical protein
MHERLLKQSHKNQDSTDCHNVAVVLCISHHFYIHPYNGVVAAEVSSLPPAADQSLGGIQSAEFGLKISAFFFLNYVH